MWISRTRMVLCYTVWVLVCLITTEVLLPESWHWWQELLVVWIPTSLAMHALAGKLGWFGSDQS